MKSHRIHHSEDLATPARAYFRVAKLTYEKEIERSSEWLHVGEWYVIQHLAFIASELFAKRLSQTVYHNPLTLEPNFTTFYGHKSNFDNLTAPIQQQLKNALSPRSLELFRCLGGNDLAIGRYPFERDVKRFEKVLEEGEIHLAEIDPFIRSTEEWRNMAEDWLKLAGELNALFEGSYES